MANSISFPAIGRGHGSKRNMKALLAKDHPEDQVKKLLERGVNDCGHEQCRVSFDRLGPLAGMFAKDHYIGSGNNHEAHLRERTFGNPPEKKQRRDAVMTQCSACQGEGRQFSFYRGAWVPCTLKCSVSKENKNGK